MEEGRASSLEMTPLTQANSLDSEGSHGGMIDCGDAEGDLAALLEGTLDESALNRAATVGRGGGGDEDRAPSDGAVASVNKSISTRSDASGGRRGAFGEGKVESIRGEAQTTRGAAILRELLVPVKLLRERRVRAILFVYCFYSVRIQSRYKMRMVVLLEPLPARRTTLLMLQKLTCWDSQRGNCPGRRTTGFRVYPRETF